MRASGESTLANSRHSLGPKAGEPSPASYFGGLVRDDGHSREVGTAAITKVVARSNAQFSLIVGVPRTRGPMIGRRPICPMSAVLLVAVIAVANGLAHAASPGSTINSGGLVRLSPTSSTIGNARLAVVLDDDGRHYRLDATYTGKNDGPVEEAWFGVPVCRGHGAAGPARESEGIKLFVGSRGFACATGDVPKGAEVPLYELRASQTGGRCGWCTAKLTLPPGELMIRLSQVAELEFTDTDSTQSELPIFSPRSLQFLLAPGEGWLDRGATLALSLKLGQFSDVATVVAPNLPPAQQKEGTFDWQLSVAELHAQPTIALRIDSSRILEQRQLLDWNRAKHFKVAIRVRGKSRKQSALVDGDPTTAWCTSAHPESSPLTIDIEASPHCGLVGLALIPGHAKDPSTYSDANRLKTIRLALCKEPKVAFEYTFEDARSPLNRVVSYLPLALPSPFEATKAPETDANWQAFAERLVDLQDVESSSPGKICMELTVIDVWPGATGRTCIGEIMANEGCP